MARIVVIDDDDAIREIVSEIVADAGHTVFAARSGREGIDLVKSERPDLVLCDVEMPGGIDGHGVLTAVRADEASRATPFLFLTALGGARDIRSGMNLGADDYLLKPVGADDLLKAIATRLTRAAAERQQSNRRIEELRRSVALLLHHELRTPLTAIIGGASLLREARAGMPDEAIREADAAFDLDPGVCVPLAPAYLGKFVGELVGNALKFPERGSPIRVSLRSSAGACLEVADAGRGMTAEQVADVGAFRQFGRALFEQQGSGLGLAIVNGITAASGGRLELRGVPGAGTAATLRWGE